MRDTETGEGKRGGRKNKGGMGRKERSGGEGPRGGREGESRAGEEWRRREGLAGAAASAAASAGLGGGEEARAAINPPSPEAGRQRLSGNGR